MPSHKRIQQIEYGVAIIIILIGVSFAWYWRHEHPGTSSSTNNLIQSHQVFGQIKSYANNAFAISGVHVLDIHPEFTNYASKSDLNVYVGPSTKFVKTVWHMPSRAALAQTNGKFNPQTIQKASSPGSLDDLRNITGMAITAKTADNTWGIDTVAASEVDYIIYDYQK